MIPYCDVLCSIPRMTFRSCQCATLADRAIDRHGGALQVGDWVCGVVLALLDLHWLHLLWLHLLGLHLLHWHLLRAAVEVTLWVVERRRRVHRLGVRLSHGLLGLTVESVLLGWRRSWRLVGVVVCRCAGLHGGDGLLCLALIDAADGCRRLAMAA